MGILPCVIGHSAIYKHLKNMIGKLIILSKHRPMESLNTKIKGCISSLEGFLCLRQESLEISTSPGGRCLRGKFQHLFFLLAE